MLVDFTRFYELLNPVYWDFFEDRNRIRLLYGGAGSGKSYYAFQEMIYRIMNEERQNYLVIRKIHNTHRASTYALTEQIIAELGLSKNFKQNKSDMTFTCMHNNNMIIFKGMDNPEKIKSVTAKNGIITSILCEEATELNLADVNQLNVRLRGLSKVPLQLTLLFNPISINSFLYKEFFLKRSFQKKNKVTILKTTYKDNNFLDDDYKSVLEGYEDIDEQFYRVYCLGEFGIFGNTIFNNYSLGKCPYAEEDFDMILNGQDFGFNHPQVISKIGFKDGVMYSYNELCCFEKTNKEIIDLNEEFDILHKGEAVTCDSAEPAKVKEWVQYGYGAISAKKGKGSVERGIDFMKTQKWVVDPDKCPRLVQELEQYSWKKDKDGEVLDVPIDLFDDAIKAHMYGLERLSRMKGKPGVLSGNKSDAKKDLIAVKKEERKKRRDVLKQQRKNQRESKRGK